MKQMLLKHLCSIDLHEKSYLIIWTSEKQNVLDVANQLFLGFDWDAEIQNVVYGSVKISDDFLMIKERVITLVSIIAPLNKQSFIC